jgi:hypothetical protein
MDQQPDEVKRQIEESRAALAAKLSLFRQRIDRIRRMSDVKSHVRRYPALTLAGSVVIGFLIGRVKRKRHAGDERVPVPPPYYYSRAREPFKDQIAGALKGAAVSAGMGLLREIVKKLVSREKPSDSAAAPARPRAEVRRLHR